jgi:hypothetical protein
VSTIPAPASPQTPGPGSPATPPTPTTPVNLFKVLNLTGDDGGGDISFTLIIPGPGTVDVLGSVGFKQAGIASLPTLGSGRFAYTQHHLSFSAGGTDHIKVRPSGRGADVARRRHRTHHRLTINLVVTYTPTGGTSHTLIKHGLRLRF